MTVPEAEILGTRVVATVVDGKIRYALPLKESVGPAPGPASRR
jgi:hypothetical protein